MQTSVIGASRTEKGRYGPVVEQVRVPGPLGSLGFFVVVVFARGWRDRADVWAG